MQIDTSPTIMNLTPPSIISCLLSSALLIILVWIILRNNAGLRFVGKYISILLAIILIRMVLPVEFHFTKSFYSKRIMTVVMDFLNFRIGTGDYSLSISQAFFILWIFGSVCKLLTTAKEYFQFSYATNRLPGYFKGNIRPIMEEINHELGKQKKFDVRLMPSLKSPAIFGVTHPKILMPTTQYSEDELYYILKHEMLHYYRHDIFVKLFCEALCIIYWWNPFVFLLRGMVIKAIELNVDNSVTFSLTEDGKESYLQCLIKSMKAGRDKKATLLMTFSSSSTSSMNQRFLCVLENSWAAGKIRGIFVMLLSALLFFLSISVIFEADYSEKAGCKSNAANGYYFTDLETSYLIKNGNHYDVYFDGEYVFDVPEIPDDFSKFKIYNNKEEIPSHE